MAACCEYGNELPVYMKGLPLFELLSEYRSLEKGVPLSACYQNKTRPSTPDMRLPYLMSRTAGSDTF